MNIDLKEKSSKDILEWFEGHELKATEIVELEVLTDDVERIGYKAFVDLAQIFFMKMLTPIENDSESLTLRFQKLNLETSFHRADKSSEKYGVDSEFFSIDKTAQFSFLYHYRQALKFINIENKNRILNLGVNRGDEFKVIQELKAYKNEIISKNTDIIEYEKNGEEYIVKTKYIPELDTYLVVEAKLNDFAKEATKVFYINLGLSLSFTFIFAIIIMIILRKYHQKLERLADFDSLTQIPNRRNFNKQFEQFLALHKRDERPICLLFIDIDDFKTINDVLGHQIGDDVLVQTAKILSESIRKTDLIARWGGEEFVIAFIGTDINDAHTITQKIREAIEKDEGLKKTIGYNLTASFGLTSCSEYDNIDTAISRADKAMYEAKQHGKNRVVLARSKPTEQSF